MEIKAAKHSPDLTGKKVGKLTVIKRSMKNKKDCWVWECLCECGNISYVNTTRLTAKVEKQSVKSCQVCRYDSKRTHGMKNTVEYRAWLNIRQRCYNKKSKGYQKYGAVGIKMCKRWYNSFTCFFLDMGKRPSNNHSIDRFPNNKGNYTPRNCRWATRSQQQRNRSCCVINMSIARQIRKSKLSNKEAALKYNCKLHTVWQVRAGKIYREDKIK